MASPYVTTLFSQAIKSVLDGWTALQLAVTQGFGGPDSREKADWMVYAIETWFKENANIENYELEEFLADVMNTEFDMILEDSSTLQVATSVCRYYRLCQEGKVEEVEHSMQSQPKATLQNCAPADDVGDNEDVEDGEMEESNDQAEGDTGSLQQAATPSEPAQNGNAEGEDMEVEDGWEVVRRGKKK